VFKCNFPAEAHQLDQLKNKVKMISHEVIQNVYDVFQSVNLVEQIMQMVFHRYYHANATSN